VFEVPVAGHWQAIIEALASMSMALALSHHVTHEGNVMIGCFILLSHHVTDEYSVTIG